MSSENITAWQLRCVSLRIALAGDLLTLLTEGIGRVIVALMKLRTMIVASALAWFLSACGSGGGVPFLQRLTATPTLTPTPTLSPTPTITPTPAPTMTPAPAARVGLGERARQNGDWERALQEYQTALAASNEPEVQIDALLGSGRTWLLADEPQQAALTLETLIQTYPDSPQLAYAFFTLAQAYSALGENEIASLAYTEYLNRRPGFIDGYVLELRGDERFAAGDYLNAAQDFRAAFVQPGLLDGTFLEMKEARAYALAGNSNQALALYDDLYNRTTNEYTKALIDLRKGQIFTALGQFDQASQVYLDAVNNYPTSYDSYSALLALVDANVPVDELNRGLVDYYAGQYGAALAAFDRYLQNSPADPGTARYYSGLSSRALGGYKGAVADWDKLIENFPGHTFWDDAWDQKAYTQWNHLEQYDEAIQTLLDFVALVPAHERAAEFLFDAGQIAEIAGDLGRAAELWERVANQYPDDQRVDRALFLAGLARYRLGDYAGAFLAFERFAGQTTDLGERAKANFWIGKTQEKLGDLNAARQSWEAAADLDPTGYYSERSVDLLQGRSPFAPPLAFDLSYDSDREQRRAEDWLVSTFGLPVQTDFNGLGELATDPRLQRGAELWEVGLYIEARAEFDELRQAVKNDPVQTYQLARYLDEIGLYRSAALAARQVLTLAGMSDAQTMNAPAYFNRLRFPMHFTELVIPLADKYGFHPIFLFSVIRQESLFESFVRSSAAARGLMQIMPATGADIAKNMGWPTDYNIADLDRPLVNVTLGVDYLDTQRNFFNGNLYAALAAYNGGPGNSNAWLRLAGDDPDLFLEIIRFSETRDYIRSIYEIFNIYRRLYDRSP